MKHLAGQGQMWPKYLPLATVAYIKYWAHIICYSDIDVNVLND